MLNINYWWIQTVQYRSAHMQDKFCSLYMKQRQELMKL